MEQRFRSLIAKYISGKITPSERQDLFEESRSMDDNRLGMVLRSVWEKYEAPESHADRLGSLTVEMAARKILVPRSRRIYFWLSAASILIVLLSGLHIRNMLYPGPPADIFTEITVPGGETASITLPDGSLVTLGGGSNFSFPVDFGLSQRLTRFTGEAFFDIARDEGKPFIISADGFEVRVLGTKFNISSYPDSDCAEITLIEGLVEVTMEETGAKGRLAPMQTMTLNKREGTWSTVPAGHDDGPGTISPRAAQELIFHSESFTGMIKKLEERYGIRIEIRGNIDNGTFSGSFREARVENILDILQSHYNFSYREKDGKIVIAF